MLDFIKTTTNALKTYVDSKFRKSRGDWNQNDKSADNYIKNRPFYTSDNIKTIVAEGTIITLNDGIGVVRSSCPLEVGTEYIIVLDGAQYNVVSKIHSNIGIPYIGNAGLIGEGEDTGELFFIAPLDSDIELGIMIASDVLEHTVSIVSIISEVHKLDKKYLPDDIGGVSDWNQDDPEAPDYIKNRPFYEGDILLLTCEFDGSEENATYYHLQSDNKDELAEILINNEYLLLEINGVTEKIIRTIHETSDGDVIEICKESDGTDIFHFMKDEYDNLRYNNYGESMPRSFIAKFHSFGIKKIDKKYLPDDIGTAISWNDLADKPFYSNTEFAFECTFESVNGVYNDSTYTCSDTDKVDIIREFMIGNSGKTISVDVDGTVMVLNVWYYEDEYSNFVNVYLDTSETLSQYTRFDYFKLRVPTNDGDTDNRFEYYNDYGKLPQTFSVKFYYNDIQAISEDCLNGSAVIKSEADSYLKYSAQNITAKCGGIAFNGDVFVTVERYNDDRTGDAKYGNILYSKDGITWNKASHPLLSINMGSLRYLNDIFVLTRGYDCLYSRDGVDWQIFALDRNKIGSYYDFRDILYANDMFIARQLRCICTSEDGLNWNKVDIEYITDMVYADDKLIILDGVSSSSGSHIYISYDFVNFTRYNDVLDLTMSSLAFGNDVFVSGGRDTLAYSSDAINWTKIRVPGLHGNVQFVNDRFISIVDNRISYSTDGITWITVDSPVDLGLGYTYTTYGKGKYLAVGKTVIRSDDGVTWVEADSALVTEHVDATPNLAEIVSKKWKYSSLNTEDKTIIGAINEINSKGGSGGSVFTVNITEDDNGSYSADKTITEIIEAQTSGKIVRAFDNEEYFELVVVYENYAYFQTGGFDGHYLVDYGFEITKQSNGEEIVTELDDTIHVFNEAQVIELQTTNQTITGSINELNSKFGDIESLCDEIIVLQSQYIDGVKVTQEGDTLIIQNGGDADA